METTSTPGPACPICGGHAFAWDNADDMIIEIGDARYCPRACAECGNVQLVLTRVDDPVLAGVE